MIRTYNLEVELANYERHGVIISLGGHASSSERITKRMEVQEPGEYMRDYIFEGGRLKEIRFDRISGLD